MTNRKSTKRALIASVISLLLCFTMLMGTTYAWFTDSVTSINNIIKTGNLDVELEWSKDMDKWETVDKDTRIFDENVLWEPGHTEVVYLRVSNAGTLALKYQLGVNVVDEVTSTSVEGNEIKLSNYIKYGVDNDVTAKYADRVAAIDAVKDVETALANAYTSTVNKLLPKTETTEAESDVVAMVVYMPEEVGNEANYAKGQVSPKITLGINVAATQYDYESDSFGSDYDEGLEPGTTYVFSAEDLKNALANGGVIMIAESIAVDEMLVVEKDTVLKMADGATLSSTADFMLYVDGIATNGVSLTILNGNYVNASETAADTTIIAAVGNSNVVIEDGTFKGNSGAGSVDAVVWAYAGDPTVTINGGSFTTGQDAGGNAGTILYVEAGTVNVKGGTFVNEGAYYWNKNWMMNLADAAYKNGTANIVVTGGVFSFDLTTESADGNHVAEGYKATEANGMYYVIEESAELAVYENETVTEIEYLNIKENQIVIYENCVFNSSFGNVNQAVVKGNLILRGCTFNGGFHLDSPNGGTVEIDDCTFTELCSFKMGAGANVTVKNSTFEAVDTAATSGWGRQWIITYGDITFENCDLYRQVRSAGDYELTFINCTYNDKALTEEVVYDYANPTITIK
ncbi:MAG: hypothetical protein IJ011_07060 [Clostridia bacterium]|nr:hypothetical protein [Clostridia bacterium]